MTLSGLSLAQRQALAFRPELPTILTVQISDHRPVSGLKELASVSGPQELGHVRSQTRSGSTSDRREEPRQWLKFDCQGTQVIAARPEIQSHLI